MSINETEKQETSTPEATEEQAPTSTSEIVEISWEEVAPVMETRREFLELDSHISSMLLRHEKEKMNLLVRSSDLERKMYELSQKIREAKNMDPSLTYELKLPTKAGEKAYFVRKDV